MKGLFPKKTSIELNFPRVQYSLKQKTFSKKRHSMLPESSGSIDILIQGYRFQHPVVL